MTFSCSEGLGSLEHGTQNLGGYIRGATLVQSPPLGHLRPQEDGLGFGVEDLGFRV